MIAVVIVEGLLHGIAVALPDENAMFVSPLDGLVYKPMLIEGSEPPLYVGLVETMRGSALDVWTSRRIQDALFRHRRDWETPWREARGWGLLRHDAAGAGGGAEVGSPEGVLARPRQARHHASPPPAPQP